VVPIGTRLLLRDVLIAQVKEQEVSGIEPDPSVQTAGIRAPGAGAAAELIQNRKDAGQLVPDIACRIPGRFPSAL